MSEQKNSTMKELLEYLKENAPGYYRFALITSKTPVTLLMNVLNDDLSVAYSTGITITKEKKIAMITIKDGVSSRTIIGDKALFVTNDSKKTYNRTPLSTEELMEVARKLQRAFTCSNFDIKNTLVMHYREKVGIEQYDAEALDDGKTSCVIYMERLSGKIKYMKTGGQLSEILRCDNESLSSLCTVGDDYKQTQEKTDL